METRPSVLAGLERDYREAVDRLRRLTGEGASLTDPRTRGQVLSARLRYQDAKMSLFYALRHPEAAGTLFGPRSERSDSPRPSRS